MQNDTNSTKMLTIGDQGYMFETLEELIAMLKEDDYEVNLHIKKKRKIGATKIIL